MKSHSTFPAISILSLTIACCWVGELGADATGDSSIPLAEISGFNAWRPYNNPSRLVNIGMNKGEVLAIAGKADREEAYYAGSRGGLVQISDWYYIRTGHNPETTLLKFIQESLVSIVVTPTR
jgi:hypothetical protein